MASKLHLRLGTIRTYSHEGNVVPVFSGLDDVETIDVTDSSQPSSFVVTEAHAAAAGGANRLAFRLVVHGDRAVRVAKAAVPDAATAAVDVLLAGSVEFLGNVAVGDKIGVVNQTEPA